MNTKRIYIVEIGTLKIYSESKDKIFKLWELLTDGNFKELRYVWDIHSTGEKFCWPQEMRVDLRSLFTDIYPSKEEAKKSYNAFEKAKKMKLIKPKKKKP